MRPALFRTPDYRDAWHSPSDSCRRLGPQSVGRAFCRGRRECGWHVFHRRCGISRAGRVSRTARAVQGSDAGQAIRRHLYISRRAGGIKQVLRSVRPRRTSSWRATAPRAWSVKKALRDHLAYVSGIPARECSTTGPRRSSPTWSRAPRPSSTALSTMRARQAHGSARANCRPDKSTEPRPPCHANRRSP
jgi:hypothetical protein